MDTGKLINDGHQNFGAEGELTTSSQNSSTSPLAPIISVDEGLSHADESGRFASNQMRELRQAVTALKKAVGNDAQSIPLNPQELRPILMKAMRFGFRGGKKRRSNVKSAIVTLAIAAGVHAARDVIEAPLTADWHALKTRLDAASGASKGKPGYLRMKLGRFMAFCSHRGIAPEAVDDGTVAAFESHLTRETLVLSVGEVVRLTVRVWNGCVGRVPGWPERRLEKPDRRNSYSFPLASFSPSFQDDFQRFMAFLVKPDRTERRHTGLVASKGTQRFYRDLLIKGASILVRTGIDVATITGLKDLVLPERVDQILDFVDARFGNDWNSQSQNMAQVLSVVARRYVKVEPELQAKLAELARNTRQPSRGLSERNRRRLQPFSSPAMLGKLAGLPAKLMARAKTLLPDDPDRALQVAEAALGIELTMLLVLRLRSLSEIEITDFILDDRRRVAGIFIGMEKTKTRDPIDAVFDPRTRDIVETYLKTYRPLRRGATSSNWLFLNRHGDRISTKNLSDHVARTVEAELGVAFNVHLFRHLAATIALDADPGNLSVLKAMLSHSNSKVTERMYGARNSSGARRKYGQMLGDAADLRKEPPNGKARAPRGNAAQNR
jgi:integrase